MTDAHHYVFREGRLSVQCEVCGLWPEEPHVVGLGFFCAEHCPCAKTTPRPAPRLNLTPVLHRNPHET